MALLYPNSFQVHNFYVDNLLHLLDGNEWKVLTYIIRRIVGFHKESDHISLTQLESGICKQNGEQLDHGVGLHRATLIRVIDNLLAFGLIILVEDKRSVKVGRRFQLQFDTDKVDFAALNKRAADKAVQAAQKTSNLAKKHPLETTKNVSSGTRLRPLAVQALDLQNPVETQRGPNNPTLDVDQLGFSDSHSLSLVGGLTPAPVSLQNPNPTDTSPKGENTEVTNTPTSLEQTPKKQARKTSRKLEPRLVPSTVETIRGIIGRYPRKELWARIDETLSGNLDTDKLKNCYLDWIQTGYNPTNLAWLFEWYVNGKPISPREAAKQVSSTNANRRPYTKEVKPEEAYIPLAPEQVQHFPHGVRLVATQGGQKVYQTPRGASSTSLDAALGMARLEGFAANHKHGD